VFSKEGRSEAISSETGAGGAFASVLRGIIYLSIAHQGNERGRVAELEDLKCRCKQFSLFKFKTSTTTMVDEHPNET
jgi:hypothetical protein